MNKLVRLVDFQVGVGSTNLAQHEQRSANLALFSTYEPVRLWLKERVIRAPFRKIVVSLSDEGSFACWHGNVSNVVGICEVMEAVDPATLVERAPDHRWVLGVVEHAIACIERDAGWRSSELEDFLKTESERSLPLVHFFESLAQTERASGVKCILWLSTQPGETVVGARIGDRDVAILSEPGPLYLEDCFPVAKSVLRRNEYVLLDKSGKALASVAIDANVPPPGGRPG